MRLLGLEWRECTAITTITRTITMMIATDLTSFHEEKELGRYWLWIRGLIGGHLVSASFYDLMVPGETSTLCLCNASLLPESFQVI